jgi:acyl carrier protein
LGQTMSIESISVIEQTSVMKDDIASGKIRALIAKHLGVEIERVTDETHFANDLGADWLDRVELVIAIEDQFAGVEITDDDVDQINVVADLIRCIKRPDNQRAGALAASRNAPPVHRFFGPRPRAEWNSLLNRSAAAK